jgi:hypothetical protein
MMRPWVGIALLGLWAGAAAAHSPSPLSRVSVEIVGPDGRVFRELPVDSRGDALRSYLQAEKGVRYQVRVRNGTGERIGLVIAVDGRNIIDGRKSELLRGEPMYVLDAWGTQDYAGWRASLDAINEFYFTDWKDSYAQAFGDHSAKGVIAIAVYREVPSAPVYRPRAEEELGRSADAATAPAAKSESRARGDAAPGTGYGARREDRAFEVEFTAQAEPDSRHFIKYEWRETLCRKRVIDCAERNRFWEEDSADSGRLGFAPPPPRRAPGD